MTKRKIVDCDKTHSDDYEAGVASKQQEIDNLRSQLKEYGEKILEMGKQIKDKDSYIDNLKEQIELILNEGLMQ